MPKIPLADICELYLKQQMTAAQIAKHFGVSRQAISERLKHAGVHTRPVRPNPPRFEKAVLVSLYVDEQLTVKQVAERLGTSATAIAVEMEKHGIPRRTRGHHIAKYPQLRNLKIGEWVDLPKPDRLKPHTQFYSMASYVGIRVSLMTINAQTMRVTRIE